MIGLVIYCAICGGVVNPDNRTIYHNHTKKGLSEIMKTAEDWNWEYTKICANNPSVHGQLLPNPQNIAFIKQIQLDALRSAAQTCSIWMNNNRLHPDIPNEKLNESAYMAAHSVLQQASIDILALADKMEREL